MSAGTRGSSRTTAGSPRWFRCSASILTVVALSSIGLPGLNGFVGEFLVLLGSFGAYPAATVVATTGVIFAAAYLLWALQRLIFNRLDDTENEHLTDLSLRELAVMTPILVGIVWMGLYPAPVLNRTAPAAANYIEAMKPATATHRADAPRGGTSRGGSQAMIHLDLSTPWGVTVALLPEILISVAALLVLLVVSWRHSTADDSRLAGWLSLMGMVVALIGLGALWVYDVEPEGLAQMVALDPFRYAAAVLALISAAGTILISITYLERERLLAPEYYPLILLATAGMMFLAGAEDLIVLFLGLEVMSVAVYVLAGFDRTNPFSAEAAVKYFLIGAFASGFLLYGIALVYGATGTTNLSLIGAQLAGKLPPLMASLGLGLLLIGFGFKVAAVPFHMWAPDVYDGSPTPVTGFMATGVKAAAFAALVRVLFEAFPSAASVWQPIIAALAIASMVAGESRRAHSAVPQADAGLQLDRARGLSPGRRLGRLAHGRRSGAAISPGVYAHHVGELRICRVAGAGRGTDAHQR